VLDARVLFDAEIRVEVEAMVDRLDHEASRL